MNAVIDFLAANPALVQALGAAALSWGSWVASRWHLGLDGPMVTALKAANARRAQLTGHSFLQDIAIVSGQIAAQVAHVPAPTAPAAK